MSKVWENFDVWADRLVRQEVTFEAFARSTVGDVTRIARVASRRKVPPSWMGIEDVRSQVLTLLWFYAMKRVDSLGKVGFDAKKYRAAGAWLRWKVSHRLAKDISRARGENQHSRRGPGAPEYLSKTGELPEHGAESEAEAAVSRARGLKKLEKLCTTAREFAILSAISRGLGDDRRVVAYLIEDKTFDDPATAYREVNAFVEAFAKKHGAPNPRSKIAA